MQLLFELLKLGSVGIIAGLFSSFLANRNFRNKKWWELRVSAYQTAIEAFSDVVHYYNKQGDDWQVQKLTEQQNQSLNTMINEALPKIRKLSDTGAFLFSDEANTALRNFTDFKIKGEIYDPDDYYGPLQAEANKCLKELVSLSRKDLSIRNSWF